LISASREIEENNLIVKDLFSAIFTHVDASQSDFNESLERDLDGTFTHLTPFLIALQVSYLDPSSQLLRNLWKGSRSWINKEVSWSDRGYSLSVEDVRRRPNMNSRERSSAVTSSSFSSSEVHN